jgi:hypothetical protein
VATLTKNEDVLGRAAPEAAGKLPLGGPGSAKGSQLDLAAKAGGSGGGGEGESGGAGAGAVVVAAVEAGGKGKKKRVDEEEEEEEPGQVGLFLVIVGGLRVALRGMLAASNPPTATDTNQPTNPQGPGPHLHGPQHRPLRLDPPPHELHLGRRRPGAAGQAQGQPAVAVSWRACFLGLGADAPLIHPRAHTRMHTRSTVHSL